MSPGGLERRELQLLSQFGLGQQLTDGFAQLTMQVTSGVAAMNVHGAQRAAQSISLMLSERETLTDPDARALYEGFLIQWIPAFIRDMRQVVDAGVSGVVRNLEATFQGMLATAHTPEERSFFRRLLG